MPVTEQLFDKQSAYMAIIERYTTTLPDNDARFLERMFNEGFDKYELRLRAAGFASHMEVLDAGCGFGQWSIALTRLNAQVTAIDASPTRIAFLRDAAAALAINNLETGTGSVTITGLPDAHFDAVFCYGVLFLTPWQETLKELTRVLKPGGLLYVNANGMGWYKHLWYSRHNAANDYDPTERAAKVMLNTWRYRNGLTIEPGMDILIEPEELCKALKHLGCEKIRWGADGTVHDSSWTGGEVPSFFPATYLGDTGPYETRARKATR